MNIQISGTPESEGVSDDGVAGEILARVFRRSMFWTPERQAPSAWIEHVPFAFWLVDVLRPRRIVELGTHNGVSYSAMCQVVKTLRLATSCFAIDTWRGDEHAGVYEEDVYRDFAAFHDQRYGAFSRLVRSSFDEALRHFEHGSIDLLHIDGLHTYEAVQHDFQSWLPKLSDDAVVLLHDTNVREREFGVFRLWNEITAGKPHFSFLHGHGLGVLGQRDYPGALHTLFNANEDRRLVGAIRETFSVLGRSVRAFSERPGLDQSLSDQATEIGGLRQALTAREDELASLRKGVSERTGEVTTLRQFLAACEYELASLRKEASERTGEVITLRQFLAAREHELTAVNQRLAERNSKINALMQTLAAHDARVNALDLAFSALQRSASWRITAPLRAAHRLSRTFRYRSLGYPFALSWRALTTSSQVPRNRASDLS